MLRSDVTFMKFKRTAKLAVVGAALAAWLAAAATSGGRRGVQPPTAKKPPIENDAALASEIARLHERLRPMSTPRQPGRNLFSFGRLKSRQASAPPVPVRPDVSEDDAGTPVPSVLKLSGIGEDVTADGVVRTAIISGLGQLFLVKEGESVFERYRVLRISPDVVELADLGDGSILRLALR